MQSHQKQVFHRFWNLTIVLGVLFALFHFFYQPDSDNLFQFYSLPVIGSSILFYLIYFRNLIHEADFQGDGKYYYPHIYFVGTLYTPASFLFLAFQGSLENIGDFLISGGILLALYMVMLFIGWQMAKYGNEEWHFGDTDS